MKFLLPIALCFCLATCAHKKQQLVLSGEVTFRNTVNFNGEMTEAETDSLVKLRPAYSDNGQQNKLYDLLVKKGIVTERLLDTAQLGLIRLSTEKQSISFQDLQVDLSSSGDRDYLRVRRGNVEYKVDLGPGLIGKRFIAYIDIDDDGERELLVLDNYYVMGGYNFDLKRFNFVYAKKVSDASAQ